MKETFNGINSYEGLLKQLAKAIDQQRVENELKDLYQKSQQTMETNEKTMDRVEDELEALYTKNGMHYKRFDQSKRKEPTFDFKSL